ncbi:hypothetical protein VE03_03216 [Pseudogymnoascus sp. 23342-1-I1]|nr:hypothetical protein VE03_03216 [Pseudogymnoascus sp. 23342-1-I1]
MADWSHIGIYATLAKPLQAPMSKIEMIWEDTKDALVAEERLCYYAWTSAIWGIPSGLVVLWTPMLHCTSIPSSTGRQNPTHKQAVVRQWCYSGVFMVCTLLAKERGFCSTPRSTKITAHLSSGNPTHLKKEDA